MITYLIIDDEYIAHDIIKGYCDLLPNMQLMKSCYDGLEAFEYLSKNEVDLIFLDIHMPDFTGFDFIQTLKNPPQVILTTSDNNFAIEAFEYNCIVDYLLKPISFPRFEKAISKAEQGYNNSKVNGISVQDSSENDLYVNIDRRLIKIDIPSIYLVEAKGDYINVKTSEQNYTVHSTLKKIEEKLPDHLFLKVHRSYIINVKEIIDIEDNSVLIKKDLVPVSRSNRPELMKRLNLL